ncbi:MAG: hypothetical protein KDA60_05895, partial [Planctomycetales bacterium]|nr:hypothetical protein [Planctomycetales bacterium]
MLRSALILVVLIHLTTWSVADYVDPQMGGGQVGQGLAPMKHADIAFDGQNVFVHLDASVGIPRLRPLENPDEFDLTTPAGVLGTKAYNYQYGWNAGGFLVVPPGSWIWIEQLEASPELEVYQRPPASPAYAPIFGTDAVPMRWRWSGSMTHNVYAVQDPFQSTYEALYRVYIGNDRTGEPLPQYGSDEVLFTFTASMWGDFDDNGEYDCEDINALTSQIAIASADLSFDLDRDGGVSRLDLDAWLMLAGKHNYDQTGGFPYLPADSNLDGRVDDLHLNAWQS